MKKLSKKQILEKVSHLLNSNPWYPVFSKYVFFEHNDISTRRFSNYLIHFILDTEFIQKPNIDYHYVETKCHEKNNTPKIIAKNMLVVDCYMRGIEKAIFFRVKFAPLTPTKQHYITVISRRGV